MSAASHQPQTGEFERIARAALSYMRANEVWIAAARPRPTGMSLVCVAAVGAYQNDVATLDLGRPAPLISRALEFAATERRPLASANLAAEPSFAHLQPLPQGSLLCIPLVEQGKPFVTLVVWRARPEAFSDSERQVAQLYANQVAMALPQLDFAASEAAQARERDAQLAAMRALTSDLDARAVITSIASEITHVITCDATLIYRADVRAGKLRVVAGQGTSHTNNLSGSEIPIQNMRSLAAKVARERRPIYNAPATPDESQSLTGALGPGWLMCEPLIAGSRLLGVVMLARARQFDESEQQALGAFTALAAAALERGELFDDVRAQRDQRAAMFASASDAFALIDDDLKVAEVNQAFANYLGVAADSLRGQNCCQMLNATLETPPSPQTCLLCQGSCKVEACLESDRSSGPFDCLFPQPDHLMADEPTMAPTPHGRHVAFRLTPVDGPEGRQALLVGRDITDERALEQQRMSILNFLTHEVRAPLHLATLNLDQALHYSRPDLSTEQRQRQESIALLNITHASNMVADIQAVFERNAGQLTVEPKPGDLSAVARQAADAVESLARLYGVGLTVEAPPNLPPAKIDFSKAEQVARNLLINALKFTPAGGSVRIATQVGVGENAGWMVLLVEDTGPGIPQEHLPYIFKRFYQGGAPAAENRHKGSGIGLAVVRYIMQGHGGEHWAENRASGGARFVMRFPKA